MSLWKQTNKKLTKHSQKCKGFEKFKFTKKPVKINYHPVQEVCRELMFNGIINHRQYKELIKDRYFPYLAVYDFEAILKLIENEEKKPDVKTQIKKEHLLSAFSICSNVPNFEQADIEIINNRPDEILATASPKEQARNHEVHKLKKNIDFLIHEMVKKLINIQEKSFELMLIKYEDLFLRTFGLRLRYC